MKCPNCGRATRPGGLDYRLCAQCGPVADGPPLPEITEDMTVNEVMEELGEDFDHWLERIRGES